MMRRRQYLNTSAFSLDRAVFRCGDEAESQQPLVIHPQPALIAQPAQVALSGLVRFVAVKSLLSRALAQFGQRERLAVVQHPAHDDVLARVEFPSLERGHQAGIEQLDLLQR